MAPSRPAPSTPTGSPTLGHNEQGRVQSGPLSHEVCPADRILRNDEDPTVVCRPLTDVPASPLRVPDRWRSRGEQTGCILRPEPGEPAVATAAARVPGHARPMLQESMRLPFADAAFVRAPTRPFGVSNAARIWLADRRLLTHFSNHVREGLPAVRLPAHASTISAHCCRRCGQVGDRPRARVEGSCADPFTTSRPAGGAKSGPDGGGRVELTRPRDGLHLG